MEFDTFYQGAPPSQTVGNLTQRTSGTYTATQFIPGQRQLSDGSSEGQERVIPVALQYTIPKGTDKTVVSQMLNAILTSREKPQVSLVGGNPERVRVEWYDQANTLVNLVDQATILVRPETDDTLQRQLNTHLKMVGNAEQTGYVPLKVTAAASCYPLQTYRKRPAIWYDLDSTKPLNIPVPSDLDPIISIKNGLPHGDGNIQDTDIIISVFYGVIVCDSAALSSQFVLDGIDPIGGFWDWAAKILKIVVKVAEVVLPIIEALADPKSGITTQGTTAQTYAMSHPDWQNLSRRDRELWTARIHSLLAKVNGQSLPRTTPYPAIAGVSGQRSLQKLRNKKLSAKRKANQIDLSRQSKRRRVRHSK